MCASELLETQRHGLVLVCYARLAKSLCKECGGGSICQHNRRRSRLPIVLADALSPAIPTPVPFPIVLADARPSALLALAPSVRNR